MQDRQHVVPATRRGRDAVRRNAARTLCRPTGGRWPTGRTCSRRVTEYVTRRARAGVSVCRPASAKSYRRVARASTVSVAALSPRTCTCGTVRPGHGIKSRPVWSHRGNTGPGPDSDAGSDAGQVEVGMRRPAVCDGVGTGTCLAHLYYRTVLYMYLGALRTAPWEYRA